MGPARIASIASASLLAGGVWIACAGEAPREAANDRSVAESREAASHWDSAEAMHRRYARAFIQASGFGQDRMPSLPVLDQPATLELDGASYRIAALELIGVARHEHPIAYRGAEPAGAVSQNKTESKTDSKADSNAEDKPLVAYADPARNVHNNFGRRSRALDDFERKALAELIRKRDLSVTTAAAGDGRRALGALRATQACLRCHASYRVGDVLGALSYRLVRSTAATAKP